LTAIVSRAWTSLSLACPEAGPALVDEDLRVRERHPFAFGARS
jgi:hypothetical protein